MDFVQPAVSPELSLPVGSKVWAVCNFGPVTEGVPGIITGVAEARLFWQSPMYLCTFANNMKVRARLRRRLQELAKANADVPPAPVTSYASN